MLDRIATPDAPGAGIGDQPVSPRNRRFEDAHTHDKPKRKGRESIAVFGAGQGHLNVDCSYGCAEDLSQNVARLDNLTADDRSLPGGSLARLG